MTNPLRRLHDLGQSVWLDFIERTLLSSGKLGRLIADDGLRGMTSNPTIFAKAISNGDHYDDDIRRAASGNTEAARVVEAVVVEDVRRAADNFPPGYDGSAGTGGLLSNQGRPPPGADTRR